MEALRRKFTKWYVRKGYRFGYVFSRYEKINSNEPFKLPPCGVPKAYWECPVWVKPFLIWFSPSIYMAEYAGAEFLKGLKEGLKEGLKMKYKVCDYCGAHLDNGETCDCRKEEDNKDSDEERSVDNGGN